MFKLTRQNVDKFFGHMEEHQYRHYNSSLGCYIYSKNHFIHEMNKHRMVPYQIAEEMAQEWDKNNPQKKYDSISPKAMDIIRSLKQSADSKGNLKLDDRAIKALMEIGAIKPRSKYIPKETHLGGFSDAS